ncbi:MAG: hypothetical protein QXH30_01815 [Candidatus Bilamarchaeaceae archaeon]
MDKKVIRQGFADIRLRVSGMIQKHRFILKKEPSSYGKYYVLCLGKTVLASEALKAANEAGFPIKAQNGLFFPAGKGPRDFLAGEG